MSENLNNVGVKKYPIIKTSPEIIKCFLSLIIQYITKMIFVTIKIGTNKLKIAKDGKVFGDIKGNKYENNKYPATNELMI